MTYDLEKITRYLRLCLVLSLLMEVVNLSHSAALWWYLDDFYQGLRQALAQTLDSFGMLVGWSYLALYLLTAFVSCFWIYRAARNTLDVAPGSGRITPGWSVGWFFVPIANYWMPFKAMRQTWNISHAPGDTNIDRATIGPLFSVWWATWVFINILGQAMSRTDSTETYLAMSFLSFPISIVSIIAYWKIIDGIHRAQKNMSREGLAEVFA